MKIVYLISRSAHLINETLFDVEDSVEYIFFLLSIKIIYLISRSAHFINETLVNVEGNSEYIFLLTMKIIYLLNI